MNNTTDIALSRLTAQMRAMDITANNLANMSTPGYRAERIVFADWLSSQTRTTSPRGDTKLAFTQDRATYRERAEGSLTQTGNPLDLALSGDGYFTVQTANGTRLTRAGRFTLQADGTITDEAGNALLDSNGQKLTAGATDTRLTVTGDGAISSENGPIGRIAVVTPADPNKLTAEGARLLRADTQTNPVAAPRVVQGAVEDSNVQPVAELVRMMGTQRDFQVVTQFVEAENQRHQTAIDKIAAPLS
jgi:flagellar basal-body rod protein FlgF